MSRREHRFTVGGQKIRSGSNRRYIVVRIIPEPYEIEYAAEPPIKVKAGAHIIRRSDSLDAARKVLAAQDDGWKRSFHVLIDQTDGRTFTEREGWSS